MNTLEAAYNAIMLTMLLKFGWEFPKARRDYRRGAGKDMTRVQFFLISLTVYAIGMIGISFTCTLVYLLIEKAVS